MKGQILDEDTMELEVVAFAAGTVSTAASSKQEDLGLLPRQCGSAQQAVALSRQIWTFDDGDDATMEACDDDEAGPGDGEVGEEGSSEGAAWDQQAQMT